MKLCFTDYPHYFSRDDYQHAMMHMVEKLRGYPGFVSVYQIGNVADPGISDIDLIAVFENDVSCDWNPCQEMSKTERYLFVHGLYGSSRQHFHDSQKHTFFRNYKKLWGEELATGCEVAADKNENKLSIQIALEYLLKMFINTAIERKYGIVKVRALFLQGKALGFDFDLLKMKNGSLIESVSKLIDMRKNWFVRKVDDRNLSDWHDNFFAELYECLHDEFKTRIFYFKEDSPLQIGRNIIVSQGPQLAIEHRGMVLPAFPGRTLGRRYFNLFHRLNRFHFTVPGYVCKNVDDIISTRFSFQKAIRHYNQIHLPAFSPLVTGLGR